MSKDRIYVVKKPYSSRPWRFVDRDGREISRTVTRQYKGWETPMTFDEPFCFDTKKEAVEALGAIAFAALFPDDALRLGLEERSVP